MASLVISACNPWHISYSFGRNKNYVDRGGGWYGLSGRREGAGGLVDVKDGDVVGFLIGGEKEISGRIKGEIAWGFSGGGKITGLREGAFGLVDGEDRDAVAAAV